MAKKKKKEIEKKTGRGMFIGTAVALLTGIFVFWAAQKNTYRGQIPDYLTGRWISSAPAYQERYLEISDVSLIFATGPATVTEYFITDITTTAKGKEISYTFECKDLQEDATYQFFMIYQPDNDGTLFFKNQPHIKWMKKPS